MVFAIVWKLYLSRLDVRYQRLMDVIAIIVSDLVVYSMLNGSLFHLFEFPSDVF